MLQIWNAFVHLLENVLLTFSSWTGSAGLGIILFTVVARLVILPLTITSIRSTRRMQEIQPLLKDLQRKYGKDQQRYTQETMKLYKEYKINPAGGCLPLLLQLPIFLAVYQAVINLTQVPLSEHALAAMVTVLGGAGVATAPMTAALTSSRLVGGFLWLPDLGKPDPFWILPILSVLLQLIVQVMAMPRVQDPQQKAMTQSMLVLPFIFGYIGFIFPSGAVLYWVTGSILSMIQQVVISGWGSLANYLKFLPADFNGFLPPATLPTPAAAGAAASGATVAVGNGVAGSTGEAAAVRRTFWDVMGPLTGEDAPADEPTDGADTTGAADEAAARRAMAASNPRRKRSRR
jgi:YidC/Oxa1 family membrane protein insertase